MILGALAVFLNFLSVLTLGVLLVIIAVSVFMVLKPVALVHYTAKSRRLLLWLIVSSPWFVGPTTTVLALMPRSHHSSNVDGLFRWHHIDEFLFYSWHGLVMVLAVFCLSFLLIRGANRLWINSRQVQLLHALAEPDKNDFYQLSADVPMAFTAGYLRPKCYMTSSLRQQLSADEYKIIQLHENEHAIRLDPLKKWVFQILTSFFPLPVSRKLNQMMVLAVEQCADLAVASSIKDKSLIAMALLKVHRLTQVSAKRPLLDKVICHYGSDHVSERIGYLLADEKEKALPTFILILVAVLTAIICAVVTDFSHHAIEYALSY